MQKLNTILKLPIVLKKILNEKANTLKRLNVFFNSLNVHVINMHVP